MDVGDNSLFVFFIYLNGISWLCKSWVPNPSNLLVAVIIGMIWNTDYVLAFLLLLFSLLCSVVGIGENEGWFIKVWIGRNGTKWWVNSFCRSSELENVSESCWEFGQVAQVYFSVVVMNGDTVWMVCAMYVDVKLRLKASRRLFCFQVVCLMGLSLYQPWICNFIIKKDNMTWILKVWIVVLWNGLDGIKASKFVSAKWKHKKTTAVEVDYWFICLCEQDVKLSIWRKDRRWFVRPSKMKFGALCEWAIYLISDRVDEMEPLVLYVFSFSKWKFCRPMESPSIFVEEFGYSESGSSKKVSSKLCFQQQDRKIHDQQ
jgi:hypothetical protein